MRLRCLYFIVLLFGWSNQNTLQNSCKEVANAGGASGTYTFGENTVYCETSLGFGFQLMTQFLRDTTQNLPQSLLDQLAVNAFTHGMGSAPLNPTPTTIPPGLDVRSLDWRQFLTVLPNTSTKQAKRYLLRQQFLKQNRTEFNVEMIFDVYWEFSFTGCVDQTCAPNYAQRW
eukprot:TRINITY_DN10888_c0_g1_i1.p1 TRINITY_DN10888_c0_g1~~TRINITY_DN10888_c0_g1_i1.p1  ORF type:complete len:172 (-),score=6.73 TRINITY_DN10888_c0_g1_i1:8-523(-)